MFDPNWCASEKPRGVWGKTAKVVVNLLSCDMDKISLSFRVLMLSVAQVYFECISVCFARKLPLNHSLKPPCSHCLREFMKKCQAC